MAWWFLCVYACYMYLYYYMMTFVIEQEVECLSNILQSRSSRVQSSTLDFVLMFVFLNVLEDIKMYCLTKIQSLPSCLETHLGFLWMFSIHLQLIKKMSLTKRVELERKFAMFFHVLSISWWMSLSFVLFGAEKRARIFLKYWVKCKMFERKQLPSDCQNTKLS